MKVTICTAPPKGWAPTPLIQMFSPIDNPEQCVLCQLWRESAVVNEPRICWVAIQTERVDKIRFAESGELERKIVTLEQAAAAPKTPLIKV